MREFEMRQGQEASKKSGKIEIQLCGPELSHILQLLLEFSHSNR